MNNSKKNKLFQIFLGLLITTLLSYYLSYWIIGLILIVLAIIYFSYHNWEEVKNWCQQNIDAKFVIQTTIQIATFFFLYFLFQNPTLSVQQHNLELTKSKEDKINATTYVNALVEQMKKGVNPTSPKYGEIINHEFMEKLKTKYLRKDSDGKLVVLYGPSGTGKTTTLENVLKKRKNVIRFQFRQFKDSTLDEKLSEFIGIPPDVIKANPKLGRNVLYQSIELMHSMKEKNEKEPILIVIFEDLHTLIKADLTGKYELPNQIGECLNELTDKAAVDKVIVVITISELQKTSCFDELSGKSRHKKIRFERLKEEHVVKMISEIEIMKQLDQPIRNITSKYIVDLLGSNMVHIHKCLEELLPKIDAETQLDNKMLSDILKMVNDSIPTDKRFKGFMDAKLALDPELVNLRAVREGLIAEMMMRCYSFWNGTTARIDSNFFGDLKNETQKENVVSLENNTFVDIGYFKSTLKALEDFDLFIRLDKGGYLFEPHDKVHIQSWKQWIKDEENLKKIKTANELLLAKSNLIFPSFTAVDSVCKKHSQQK